MNRKRYKFSVVILNYNGKKVISQCLSALEKQSIGLENFEVVVVDNNSKDDSINIATKFMYKTKLNMRIINNSKNLGFSKGNNIGIKNSDSEFVCLLNNDCVPEKKWLEEMLKTFKKNRNIFSISSKVLLFPTYSKLPVEIKPENIQSVFLKGSKILDFTNSKKLKIDFFVKNGEAIIEIPSYPGIEETCSIEVKKNDGHMIRFTYKNSSSESVSKVQNAGIYPFQDGYCRDIGAKVVYQKQYYEDDLGQYDKPKKVYASCGAALGLRRKLLNKIGLLNENFFMYYEDVEISERATQSGYTNIYCPKAVVRHLHAYSSKESSAFFQIQVEKGRLLHMFYHWPIFIFLKELVLFLMRDLKNHFRLKSIGLLLELPNHFAQKADYQRHIVVSSDDLFKKIQSGYWYEN